jgi:predicted ABC-type ATPase
MSPQPVPRLRMFAGPNGSGKSTIKSLLTPELLGIYINPDDIQTQVKTTTQLDLRPFGIRPSKNEIIAHFVHSSLAARAGMSRNSIVDRS